MTDLNQFYTQKEMAKAVVEMLTVSSNARVLELCAGQGSLLKEVRRRFDGIRVTSVDIDNENVQKLSSDFGPGEHLHADVLSPEFLMSFFDVDQAFDVAVCNPPFGYTENLEEYSGLLKEILGIKVKDKKIRKEIVLICENLKSLKFGGELAVIVPEFVIKSIYCKKYRDAICNHYVVEQIIEFDSGDFKNTEAKTYGVLIRKAIGSNGGKSFESLLAESNNIVVDKDFCVVPKINSYDIDGRVKIIRGNLSGKGCREIEMDTVHSDFVSSNDQKHVFLNDANFEECEQGMKNYKFASNGDMLVVRVGSRVIGSCCVLEGGAPILSDCVFALRFSDDDDRDLFWSYWCNNRGQLLELHSTGTCAKHITIKTMKNIIASALQ